VGGLEATFRLALASTSTPMTFHDQVLDAVDLDFGA
jgi:hypothetical protein